MDQALNSQKTPHTSPLRASYGMSFVSILMKNDRVIKGFYCNGLVPNRQQTSIWTNNDLVYWFIDTALSLNEVTHDILMACNEGLW